MMLLSPSSSSPVSGGQSDFISSASSRRSARSRFMVAIARRSLSSEISTANRLSSSSLSLPSSRVQYSRPSSLSCLCGSSKTYIGRDSAISSYIFFLPSQVVSATIRSAISRNGFAFSTWNPNVDLISGQRLTGRCSSAGAIISADPPHRHTGTAPAARISSRGVNSHMIPTMPRPDSFAAEAYSRQFCIIRPKCARGESAPLPPDDEHSAGADSKHSPARRAFLSSHSLISITYAGGLSRGHFLRATNRPWAIFPAWANCCMNDISSPIACISSLSKAMILRAS